MPFKHHVSSTGLASASASVSAEISVPISLSPWKWQETAVHQQKLFGDISLCGGPTNGAQLHSVRRTNTCVSLTKNPSSHVLSQACFSRTSFLLCLLQSSVPSRVCLSLSPVSTSGIFHLCPLQENTPLPVCPSTQVTNTTGLPKNTQVSIANRTLVE